MTILILLLIIRIVILIVMIVIVGIPESSSLPKGKCTSSLLAAPLSASAETPRCATHNNKTIVT